MTARDRENDARDQNPGDGDVLGGPDRAAREDIVSAPGQEPAPGRDILGGPDPAGPEDEFTAPGQEPARAAPDDVVGPGDAEPDDTMSPPGQS